MRSEDYLPFPSKPSLPSEYCPYRDLIQKYSRRADVPKAKRRFYVLRHAVAVAPFNAGAGWCGATATRFRRGEVVVYGRCRCRLAESRSRASRNFFLELTRIICWWMEKCIT
jgi:hypothetical protein